MRRWYRGKILAYSTGPVGSEWMSASRPVDALDRVDQRHGLVLLGWLHRDYLAWVAAMFEKGQCDQAFFGVQTAGRVA